MPSDPDLIQRLRAVAQRLYEGVETPHRSCGVAIAETFGRDIRPYLMLRRGGLTGERECGALRAGEMVLAELLGSADPEAPLAPELMEAVLEYRRRCDERLDRQPDLITCNELLAPYADRFDSPERKEYCTGLAAGVAEIVAEIADQYGVLEE